MKSSLHILTRLRLDAALYQLAPPRQPKQTGRPRKVGKRLPALKELIENPYTPWKTVAVKDWYGYGNYTLQIASHTAVWYQTGLPPLPSRWVLIKDPKNKARIPSPSMYRFIGSPNANFAMVSLSLVSGSDF